MAEDNSESGLPVIEPNTLEVKSAPPLSPLNENDEITPLKPKGPEPKPQVLTGAEILTRAIKNRTMSPETGKFHLGQQESTHDAVKANEEKIAAVLRQIGGEYEISEEDTVPGEPKGEEPTQLFEPKKKD